MNITGSVLSYHPKIEDQGKFLSCRAENPQIPDSGVEKGFTLNLHRKSPFQLFYNLKPFFTLRYSNPVLFRLIRKLSFSFQLRSSPYYSRVWHKSGCRGKHRE